MAEGAQERRRPPQRPPGSPPRWRVEGTPAPANGEGGPRSRPPRRSWLLPLIAGLFLVNWILGQTVLAPADRTTVSYNRFFEELSKGNVAELNTQNDRGEGVFKATTEVGEKDVTRFKVIFPKSAFTNSRLDDALRENKVELQAKSVDQSAPIWQQVLIGFGPTLLFIGLLIWFFRRSASLGGGMLSGLGRSKAKRYDAGEQTRVTFEDVAGIDEAEEELVEVVDFLRNPDKYRKLGAQIPRGVLLSGLPGTGKTLLARAVAGEAKVPFFSLSASEFVEMIVGVGASRVRDLFAQAKAAAPAIIFIDELDAIGRARGGGMSLGGNDEREQTLNQILTEMDGFSGSEGVIVLAATNRPEILDPALLRAGRFDRRVAVNPPDKSGREQILRVHTRHVPLAEDVDLASLASTTPGMVGADLKNLVNEAALMAARRGHDKVRLGDFTDSLEKILLGAERKIILSQADRERTAYHESGHAILGMLQPGADPVRKVSIVPRGRALGVTFQSPDSDQYGYSAEQLRGRIIGALGGRAAEKIIYGEITTGAESDLEQVTRIARMMVGRWGMSESVGAVSVLPGPQDEPLLFPGSPGTASEATRKLVDDEVRRIVEECEQEAERLLLANRDKLESLTRALLEQETLDEEDAYRAAGIGRAAR